MIGDDWQLIICDDLWQWWLTIHRDWWFVMIDDVDFFLYSKSSETLLGAMGAREDEYFQLITLW